MSVHTAYVNAIRGAQHFIYIENQYFLGSSFNWDSHKDVGKQKIPLFPSEHLKFQACIWIHHTPMALSCIQWSKLC